MQVFTGLRNGSAAVAESIAGTIADAIRDNILPQIAPPVMQEIASLPKVSRKKVLRIRRQLDNGTYDIDERLDAVLERILTDIEM
jgi:hypothetical protein